MQAVEINEVWIIEPRWSWFKTPLWEQVAVQVDIRFVDAASASVINSFSNTGGGMISTVPLLDIGNYRIYFTPEEYVMFKLMNKEHEGEYDIRMLRARGIIYG